MKQRSMVRRLGHAALASFLVSVTLPQAATATPTGAATEGVQVPAGQQLMLETVGRGLITYECRAKKDAAGQFEWGFLGPDAVLTDRGGKSVGRYFGPPATWEHADGSKVTGTQLATAPAGVGNIPLQLVKANPATGMGAMSEVSYIQRMATQGGVAPTQACTADNLGQKTQVQYQADYLFYRSV